MPFDSDNDSATVAEDDKKPSQDQSENWDIYIEKPDEVNKWESELTSAPDATWGVKEEPFDNWGNNNSGWGDAPANPSWHALSNTHYASNNRNDFYAGSNNRYQSGRKRNSGGHFLHWNNRQRSGWQDHRGGRNVEWRHIHRTAVQLKHLFLQVTFCRQAVNKATN
jgi:hypothetical protein